MLKRACICVAVLSFLVLLGLPFAQAQTADVLIVQVPFDFYVRDQMLPAGKYVVGELTQGGRVLRIRSKNGTETAAVLTNSASTKGRQADNPRLIFHRYGDQYFLAAAWRDADWGRELTESKRERNLRQEMALGGHAITPEIVTLTASLTDE